MQQLLLELQPPAAASFDNFVPGGNAAAVAALRHWLADPRGTTSFFLWGAAGSGRRHLLAASGARPLPAGEFAIADVDDATDAAAHAVYALAAVDSLAEAGQIALFNAFNRLKLAGGKLLLAGTQPPAALAAPTFREDLRTRIASGLVYRLLPLSDQETRSALGERAAARGLKLGPDAIDYLLRHARRDMGTLSALIDALDRFTLQHKRAVTLPLLRSLLQAPMEFSEP